MSGFDQSIIFFYLCALIVLGIFLKRRAEDSLVGARDFRNDIVSGYDRHYGDRLVFLYRGGQRIAGGAPRGRGPDPGLPDDLHGQMVQPVQGHDYGRVDGVPVRPGKAGSGSPASECCRQHRQHRGHGRVLFCRNRKISLLVPSFFAHDLLLDHDRGLRTVPTGYVSASLVLWIAATSRMRPDAAGPSVPRRATK